MIGTGLFVGGGRSGGSQPTLHPSHLVGATASGAPQQAGHVWHMKKVEVKTGVGWDAQPMWGIQAEPQRQMVAMTMLIPADWSFNGGAITPSPNDCNFTNGRLGFFTTSSDKKTGMVSMPLPVSMWSNNQQILQAVQMDNQKYGQMQKCKVEQPGPLASKMAQIAQLFGKGVSLVGAMEPIPGVSDSLAASTQRANQQLAQQGGAMSSQITAEAGRVKMRSDQKPNTDLYLEVVQVVRTDRMANGLSVTTIDYPFHVVTFAPEGQYAGMEAQFAAMLDSVSVSPEYVGICERLAAGEQSIKRQMKAKISQIESQMAADNLNAARQQAAIRAGVQNYSNQVHANVAANRSAALEHSSQQFAMHMGDQALYHDSATGQNVQLSNQYGHAWASTTGNTNEYILTDSPSYNPNGQVGSGSWTQMSQIK
jgi:hypothetical protein